MKKIIALLLVAIMVLGTVACGTKKEDAKKPETVGATLLAAFKENPDGTAQEVAERIVGNEIIFMHKDIQTHPIVSLVLENLNSLMIITTDGIKEVL